MSIWDPFVVNQSWILINFEEQKGPAAGRNGVFSLPVWKKKRRRKTLFMSSKTIQTFWRYLKKNHTTNFSNTDLGFDLHFSHAKTNTSNSAANVPNTLRRRRKKKQQVSKKRKNTFPLSGVELPFERESEGSDATDKEWHNRHSFLLACFITSLFL